MTADPLEPHIGLVVEGRGELNALPLLLRTYLHRREVYADILGRPVPCHGRDKALVERGLEGKVATAAARPGCKAVVAVLDGEGDPVCALGPQLLTRAIDGALGKPVVVSLADPKYEAWLVASAETMELSGLAFNPIPDPVGLIRQALAPQKYVKPTWQPRLTNRMDLDLAASRSRSLARLLDRFGSLVQQHFE